MTFAQTTGMFVPIILDVHILTLLVLSSGAHVYDPYLDAHHSCLEVLNDQITAIQYKTLPLRSQEIAAQTRDLQNQFNQSEEEKWRMTRFIHAWFNVCKIEDVADRAYKTVIGNFELYLQAQVSHNLRNIETAQRTALTSPFRSCDGQLQFILGRGTAEISKFENIVTVNGRECIFRLLHDDLCKRFMTVDHLGGLASEQVTLSYLDHDNQVRMWSGTFLDVFDYDMCLTSPAPLQDVLKGRGPNEKSDTSVCSLLPVEPGWEGYSLAQSQFLQRVFKRLHLSFSTGSSRSASFSKDGTYDSPLPLVKEVFGGDVARSTVGNKRRKSGDSSSSSKRGTNGSMDKLSISADLHRERKQDLVKSEPRQDLNAEDFNPSWWIDHAVLTLTLSLFEYTHWLELSVEPYLTHRRKDVHPIMFLVPVLPLNARKYLATQCRASKAPTSDAVRNCLSSLSLFQYTLVVLKRGNSSAASSLYLADHPSYRLTIFNQLEPSDPNEASSSDDRGVETIELRLSQSCRQKIPVVKSTRVVDPVDNTKTIVLPTVFDTLVDKDNKDGSSVSLLYSYLSSRMVRRELSAEDKDLLEAERRVAAARRNE